ncbi:Putative NADPH-dependent methylglyoxal reductase [Clavispora lusitaniae]|uniref:NADPH-dependent methylglyoxal reductase n=1 Tax=Clavispora lusitaniae TaxID=36911 RepID=A0ACD0WG08_CLALS|nr:Putative NADPH-dependent methylglyoxal reductase [Clavispora lusitaniae]QFZ31844.1 Putative NADPH-dependent methylglyoxal reductase [Clavispora lusitaniae]QFZ37513.1 Putative NADPH-dependent methylglyoxal reductase [Clavispora lusitaniae]QFZ43197.1 Putative NADPH-dependent methylglyoxal reductase [Clavispora lusitaniae]QFZ48873.1 Putative NADPH-dependent methylglyoxal reductase [Clavispora lusitaniae]
MTQTVLVSGASGFIALHTVKHLLEKGYSVVGSVRSTEKGENLKKLLGSDKFSYEIVKDIVEPGAFDDFVKKHPEATVFLHTASPFHFNVTDVKKDLLEPAVNGTRNALSAVKKFGPQIKRVVVTSSYAAIMSTLDPSQAGSSVVENEETWNPLTWEGSLENALVGYCGSKKFAEKAAWDFVEQEKPNFVLSTVNPVYVFGPQAFDALVTDSLNTSAEVINGVLKAKGSDAEIPKVNAFAVDVRDVADAHIAAFEKNEAKSKRLLLSAGPFTQQTILDVLHKDFPDKTKAIPAGNPGEDKEAIKNFLTLDNSWTKSVLGFKLKTVEESIHDTVAQIFKLKG